MSRAGQDRLQTRPLKAAIYTVYLQSWPNPCPLIGGKFRLAKNGGGPDLTQVFVLVKGDASQLFSLFVGNGPDIVVESIHGDPPILIMHRVQDLDQGVDRVNDGSTVRPGVQIMIRSLDVDVYSG